jgi:cellulose 1,4-beta-cellobiosidase
MDRQLGWVKFRDIGGIITANTNLAPGAKELSTVWKNAGSPKALRGFSTNVAGWNSFDLSPGEFANSPDGKSPL